MNMAASGQNLRRQPDCLAEILGDGSQRRQKKIAEAVAFEARAFLEAVLEQLRQKGFVFGESHDAVANVAGRQHVEFFAEAPAGTAVVADRHYRAKIVDTWFVNRLPPPFPG